MWKIYFVQLLPLCSMTRLQHLTRWCELADVSPEAAAQVGGAANLGAVTPDQLGEVASVLTKARGIEVVELDLWGSDRQCR